MKQALPRIMLAAPSSGSGKTAVTCGLLKALIDRGVSCTAWKCGPDYIDPMYHKYVLGVNGGNLDSFFLDEKGIRSLLRRETKAGDVAVMEGVMGYFDGVAGISAQASSYDIARITQTPVLLVVDCKGSSLSVTAIIKGFLDYRPKGMEHKEHNQIKGVLLNRISKVMAQRLIPSIEALGVTVAGWIPDMEEMRLESRHLGLVMPEETKRLKQRTEAAGKLLAETVDIEKILEIAYEAPDLYEDTDQAPKEELCQRPAETVHIAVAKDAAFCFYYQENIRLLERFGAKITYFSPLSDAEIPQGIQGLILGGGYPELYASALSENCGMRESVRCAVGSKIPLLAECGGFLYLHEQLEGEDGTFYPMAGVLKGRAYRTGKLSRFGYISLEARGEDCCLKSEIRGHEFHYWDSTDCGEDWKAVKPLSTKNWNCIHSRDSQIMGFPHLYYPSNPDLIGRWIKACAAYKP